MGHIFNYNLCTVIGLSARHNDYTVILKPDRAPAAGEGQSPNEQQMKSVHMHMDHDHSSNQQGIFVTQMCGSPSQKISVFATTIGASKKTVWVSWRRRLGSLLGKSSPQQRFRLGSLQVFAVKCIQISWHVPTSGSKWILCNKNSKVNTCISGSLYTFGVGVLLKVSVSSSGIFSIKYQISVCQFGWDSFSLFASFCFV